MCREGTQQSRVRGTGQVGTVQEFTRRYTVVRTLDPTLHTTQVDEKMYEHAEHMCAFSVVKAARLKGALTGPRACVEGSDIASLRLRRGQPSS